MEEPQNNSVPLRSFLPFNINYTSAHQWLQYLQGIANEHGSYLGNRVQEVDIDRTMKLNRIDS